MCCVCDFFFSVFCSKIIFWSRFLCSILLFGFIIFEGERSKKISEKEKTHEKLFFYVAQFIISLYVTFPPFFLLLDVKISLRKLFLVVLNLSLSLHEEKNSILVYFSILQMGNFISWGFSAPFFCGQKTAADYIEKAIFVRFFSLVLKFSAKFFTELIFN